MWYRRLTYLGLLLASVPVAQARAQEPTLIATMTSRNGIWDAAASADGRRLYFQRADSVFLYEFATRRSTPVTTGNIWRLVVSGQGDQLAFARRESNEAPFHIWTLPLNPSTGLPTGPARRASVTEGDYPAFSPDGRSIAFAAGKRIVVIPALGGTERLVFQVSETETLWAVQWSSDGRWIYFRSRSYTEFEYRFQRVAAEGGAPQMLAERVVVGWPGVSSRGPVLAFSTAPGAWRIEVADLNGRHLGDIAWLSDNRRWLGSTSILQWKTTQTNALKAISLTDGTIRELLPAEYDIRDVAWAPDGRRYAAVSQVSDSLRVLVMDADARIRHTVRVGKGTARDLSWSPDGSRLVLLAGDSLRILTIDATSGALRPLQASGLVDRPRWTADSRHVLYVSGTPARSGGVRAVRRVSLDGTDVLVREVARGRDNLGGATDDWSYQYGDSWNLWFASDSTAIVKQGDTTRFVRLTTGSSTPVLDIDPAPPSVSPRGDLIALRPLSSRDNRTFQILRPTGQAVATLKSQAGRAGPFILRRILFTPDSRSIIYSAGASPPAGRCCLILQASVDGSSTRTLVDLTDQDYNQAPYMALSPDGRTLLFTSGGPYVSRFYSTDISGMVGSGARP